jgi:NAD(P)-dependent dehydrogenase (short-subunit alcohol dehydrogenase family)
MKDRNRELEGKVAIVTGAGAAGGLGYVIAKTLAEARAKVVLTGRRPDELKSLTAGLVAEGLDCTCELNDLGSDESIRSVVETTVKKLGRLDILVNNAAVTGHPKDLDVVHQEAEVWDQIFVSNARGTMLFCKYSIPHMLKQGKGSIINISSDQSLAGDIQFTAYGSSKGAINSLTRYTATQYGKAGIRVNALTLGLLTSVKMTETLPPPRQKVFEDHHLMGLGRCEDVAEAVRFLASDASRWVTGQVISIDGGFFAHNPSTVQVNELVAQMVAAHAAKQG